MKISTNAINNYVLQPVKQANHTVANKKLSAGALSDDEKKFFVKAYPDKKNEVIDYQYYNRKEKLTGVVLGTIVDRKG